jgi:hypothetical protein
MCNSRIYIRTIYTRFLQSGLGRADSALKCSLCYNGYLDTWTALCLIATKFQLLLFFMPSFFFSYVTNVCIFVILYDLSVLPAQFCYAVINIWHMERYIILADPCTSRKFTSSAENLVSQALKFRKFDICRKFPCGASISHYWLSQCLMEVYFNASL